MCDGKRKKAKEKEIIFRSCLYFLTLLTSGKLNKNNIFYICILIFFQNNLINERQFYFFSKYLVMQTFKCQQRSLYITKKSLVERVPKQRKTLGKVTSVNARTRKILGQTTGQTTAVCKKLIFIVVVAGLIQLIKPTCVRPMNLETNRRTTHLLMANIAVIFLH